MPHRKEHRPKEKGLEDPTVNPFEGLGSVLKGLAKGVMVGGVVTISKRTGKTYKGVPVTEYKEGVSGGQSVAKQAEDILYYDRLKKAEAYLKQNPKEAKRLGLQIPKPDK